MERQRTVRKIKKGIKTGILLIMILLAKAGFAIGSEVPSLSAASAVLIEASSGQVLFARNAYNPRPPASTTKIVTALIGLERGSWEEEVKVSSKAAKTGGSTVGLEAERVYRLGDLITAALVCSANDAATAIGECVGGEEKTFVALMNHKAAAVGARATNFSNPTGLPAAEHYASAFDLALLARYALANPVFSSIVAMKEAEIGFPPWHIYNTNRLLRTYSGADGVKTGTTRAAGQCLVASATRGGRQLIAVVLKSRSRFEDAARLLDYGFTVWDEGPGFAPGEVIAVLPVCKGNTASVEITPSERLGIAYRRGKDRMEYELLFKNIPVEAPFTAGTTVGEAVIKVNGEEKQRIALTTLQSVGYDPFWWGREWLKEH